MDDVDPALRDAADEPPRLDEEPPQHVPGSFLSTLPQFFVFPLILVVTLSVMYLLLRGLLGGLPGLVILGFGMGLTMTPATEAITATLPQEKQGVASALNDTSREVGGALGVALLGSILSSGYRTAIDPSLEGLPPELAETAREGIGSAYAAAESAGADAPRIIDAAQHAFVEGWVSSMWVGVAMAGVALVILIFRGPGTGTAVTPPTDRELEVISA